MSRRAYECVVIASAVIAYFLIFPADLAFVEWLLRLTNSVATGAWALLIAVVVVAGAARMWAGWPPRRAPRARRSGQPSLNHVNRTTGPRGSPPR